MNTILRSSYLSLFGIILLMLSNFSHALVSIALKDVITSRGSGDINLMKPFDTKISIDGALLEQFRQNNSGHLVFAIDVNEASNGTEKASTQGVTIKSLSLHIIINGIDFFYTEFSTRTTSMLAEGDSTQRKPYYTLIGNTGSNRITPSTDSGLYNSSFDASLSIELPIDISEASSVQLSIEFLNTNISLGDPEAFYDYTNGYEDVAIITNEDHVYLDELSPGRTEAPLVLSEDTTATASGGVSYYPTQSTYYLAAYEDLFPNLGDYDFNDLVVAYRVATTLDTNGDVTSISGVGYLIARGAGYNHDWFLRINLPDSVTSSVNMAVYAPNTSNPSHGYPVSFTNTGDLNLKLFSNTRDLWKDGIYEGVNTLQEQALLKGHRFTFTLDLDTPISIVEVSPPFDPYLYVHDTGFEIHLEGQAPRLPYSNNILQAQTSFTDQNNYPFALVLPEDWLIPVERVDIGTAYPDLVSFISSQKKQFLKWYQNPNTLHIKNTTPNHWKW